MNTNGKVTYFSSDIKRPFRAFINGRILTTDKTGMYRKFASEEAARKAIKLVCPDVVIPACVVT